MFTKGKGSSGSDVPAPSFEPIATNSPPPQQRRPQAPSGPSIINSDVLIRGSVSTKGELQLDGSVEGDVRARKLTVGGSIKGDVIGEEVVTVRGEVQGRIRGRRVELIAGSRVQGDVIHAQLSIEPGAQFEGQVRYVQDPLADAPKPQLAGGPAPVASTTPNATPLGDKPNFGPTSSSGGAAVA
ncbi:MAG: polymer-forming cytoskeletal protein [Caulobacterales bacterium]